MYLSQAQGICFMTTIPDSHRECFVAVCPQVHTAGKPGRLGLLSPPHTFLWPILTWALEWLVYTQALVSSPDKFTPRKSLRIRQKSPSRDPAITYLHTSCFPVFPILLLPSSFSWEPFLNKLLAKNHLRICFWRTQDEKIPRPMKTQVYDLRSAFPF